ncbi:glycosyltransferase family 2 protein [Dialister succinatiphilus]|uniref:glycosyltransferase family 2 protein n=1 Tax=Dialister succinatiphilus TaxID=487173 RepID=UPI003F8132E9
MSKLLTISIAAYNVEKTIEECLDSFLPCRHLKDLEILVINDGSHDRTAEIVAGYEKKYPESIHLVNKENGGHGSTLNKSLELASGKFYKAVDGDDWVDASELDRLCDCLEKTEADLVVDRYKEVYPDHTQVVDLGKGYALGKVYSFDELFAEKKCGETIFAMHSSTIRTERLHAVGMKIQEHCFYADNELDFYIVLAAETVLFTDTCVYQYRLGSAGQSVSPEGIFNHIEDLIKITRNLTNLLHKYRGQYKNRAKDACLFAIVNACYASTLFHYTKTIQRPEKDQLLVEFLRDVNQKYPALINQMHLSRIDRYVAGNPAKRVPAIRKVRKTWWFKALRQLKHLVASGDR